MHYMIFGMIFDLMVVAMFVMFDMVISELIANVINPFQGFSFFCEYITAQE